MDWNGDTGFESVLSTKLGGYTLNELEFMIKLSWSSIPEFYSKEDDFSINKLNLNSETLSLEEKPEFFIKSTIRISNFFNFF